MKRLLAVPMCFATACTLTISTTGTHKHNPARSSYHKTVNHFPRRATPEPSPEIKERVHEQYRDIYEKINP